MAIKKKSKKDKIGRVIFYSIMSVVGVVLLLLLMSVVLTRQSNNPPAVFGYRLFIVTSDSMEPAIPVRSAIVVKETDVDDIKENDIISFKEGIDKDGLLIINTHRVVKAIPAESGMTFVTKGDKNLVEDSKLRVEEDIYGTVVRIMPGFGKFILFVQSPIGLVTCVAVPLLLLLLFEIFHLIRLSKKPIDDDEFIPYEERADLFGTHSDNPSNPLTKTKGKRLAKENNELKPPVRTISSTLYDTQAEKANVKPLTNFNHDQTITTRSDDEPQIRSEPITVREREEPVLRTQRIITKQEEEEEILNNMNAFAMLKAKRDNQSDRLHVLEQFTNSDTEMAVITNNTSAFKGRLQSKGEDQFTINDINVTVKPNAINLNFDEVNKKEISITVTDGYTNVVIQDGDTEVNFGLFKDENDNSKVTIQKKNKE